MQEEIWKDVVGYEGLYQVSNLGRVYSLPKEWVTGKYNAVVKHEGKFLTCSLNAKGYYHVTLTINKKYKSKAVHQMVAEAFLNHVRCGHKLVIDHINDDPTDNRLENLQIVTHRFNVHKTQGKYSSKYKGVCWNKQAKKWQVNAYINGKQMALGLFTNEEDASKRYIEAITF